MARSCKVKPSLPQIDCPTYGGEGWVKKAGDSTIETIQKLSRNSSWPNVTKKEYESVAWVHSITFDYGEILWW